MDRRRGFTLIELLVVISIIALLMAILMPTLSRVRRQAKAVACQQQLGQWGKMFMMYTMDNNGYFMRGWVSNQSSPKQQTNDYWINALRPYYKKQGGIMLCPMATKPRIDIDGNATGARNPFAAWGKVAKGDTWAQNPPLRYIEGDYGSYGINMYVYDPPVGTDNSWYTVGIPDFDKLAWRTPNVKNANRVPLFLDSAHLQTAPLAVHSPPEYSGDQSNAYGKETMQHVCQDRHDGYVNGVFLDFTVRKIGLKELWKLKWSRNFDINGVWTLAYYSNPADCADKWDKAAPWMKNMPEY